MGVIVEEHELGDRRVKVVVCRGKPYSYNGK
jgi:hypothetical protein